VLCLPPVVGKRALTPHFLIARLQCLPQSRFLGRIQKAVGEEVSRGVDARGKCLTKSSSGLRIMLAASGARASSSAHRVAA
jgi:hypothetical protein